MSPAIHFTTCHYPESDGKPMGETDEHRDEMVRHIEILRHHFLGQQVYVSGNLLVYYEQGNPKKFVVPDCFVVKGSTPRKRRIFQIWAERSAPHVVIETTSRKTRKKDTKDKPDLYARLGVREYFLFDPDHEYLDPALQGHRLTESGYVLIDRDADNSLISQELELRLQETDGKLQFFRLDTGGRLLTAEERASRESEARQRETEARMAAEAEVRRLREELARHGPA